MEVEELIKMFVTNTYIQDKGREGRDRNLEELFSRKIRENLFSVLPISQKLYGN